MKKVYGTLEYGEKQESSTDNSGYIRTVKRKAWIVRGFQVVQMVRRIVPDSTGIERNAASVSDSIVNIDHLKWIMQRYPLEIKSPELWNERLGQLEVVNKKKDKLMIRNQASPTSLFQGKLLDFQREGLDFLLKTSGNALLADDMGLGKTVQSIAYFCTEKDALPAVIVAQLVVLKQWEREINNFMILQKKDEYIGKMNYLPRCVIVRDGKSGQLPDADFYIINYDMVAKRRDDLIQTGFKTLLMDEVQNIRDMNTLRYDGIVDLAEAPTCKHRIGLSGTPIYNRGSEIFPIVNILQPGLLGTWQEFLKTYCHMNDSGKWVTDVDKQDALSELLKENIMLRRVKKDVLTQLPEKTRYTENVEIDQEYYENEIDKLVEKIEQEKAEIISNPEGKHKLFQLSSMYQRAMESERQIAGISKAPYVRDFVKEMMEIDEKVVVFVHHLAVHSILMKGLEEFKPRQIIGGQTDDFRQNEIDVFQNDPESKLLIAALRAGSVGINLTAASYVIFGELDWTPAYHRQAEDRLHRIGQKKPVFAHYLIGDGTYDETIAKVLVSKSLEIDSVIGDKKEIIDNEKAERMFDELKQRMNQAKSLTVEN